MRATKFISLSVVSTAAALLIGCASVEPPIALMAVAKSSIANAEAAGGNEFAVVNMRAAQEKYEQARRAMEKEQFADAKLFAEQAQTDAKLAEKKSQAAKAQKAAAVIEDDLRILREEINRKTK